MGVTNTQTLNFSRRDYRPLLELGRGGMARVYLAESLASGIRKLVVLKVLNQDLAHDAAMRAAFRQEAELSARMNHPNVVQVYEVVEHDGVPVIVMEYLDGVALSRLLQHARLPLRLHLYVLSQVLAGLHHFHELRDFEGADMNAVHRDVSPQNVLVLHEGVVKVVDFGIAKIANATDGQTRTGMIKGKIHYMPPEQLLGDGTIDRRADIFAVGVMLWEAIAGRRMWDGMNEPMVIRALAQGELPSLRAAAKDVPEEFEQVCQRALAFDKKRRYSTALEMQGELEQALYEREGYVQVRELTEFMLTNFGDRRQFQQRAIERALRSPAATMSGVMECVTPPAVTLDPSYSRSDLRDDVLQQLPSSPGSAVEIPAPRRRWKVPVLAGVGLCAVAAAGAVAYAPHPAAGVVAPAAVSERTVQLQVIARPAEAQIRVDGAPLGTGRIEHSFAPSDRPRTVEVVLAGHASERRTVQLLRDTTLEVNLRPEPRPEDTRAGAAREVKPTVTAESSSPAAPRQRTTHTPSRPAGRAVAPAEPQRDTPSQPTVAPTTKGPGVNCKPPYKLSADGVRVFKPECL